MINVPNKDFMDVDSIEYDSLWEEGDFSCLSMHSIHTYPAKFPPFIVSEAFDYAVSEGVIISSVADIFCGCGTTALETKRRGLTFWGCDINPIATMITNAKIEDYSLEQLARYYQNILKRLENNSDQTNYYLVANKRLKYWFTENQYNKLYYLLDAINRTIPAEDVVYLNAFHCIFSSILKKASRWLQKSIKPQVDPQKKEYNIMALFVSQYKYFYKAVEQLTDEKIISAKNQMMVVLDDFLNCNSITPVDLIITSPPYVTSYEYADLHQLSSLWLSYTENYKLLRKGTIGSCYDYGDCIIQHLKLNFTANKIVNELQEKGCLQSKIIPIARYYAQMQKAVKKCYTMINNNGMALFVIGDSELKGVKLENSMHLVESMKEYGFTDIKIGKRTVSKGICIPYRDDKGRFTKSNGSKNRIYQEEYIISGRKT